MQKNMRYTQSDHILYYSNQDTFNSKRGTINNYIGTTIEQESDPVVEYLPCSDLYYPEL